MQNQAKRIQKVKSKYECNEPDFVLNCSLLQILQLTAVSKLQKTAVWRCSMKPTAPQTFFTPPQSFSTPPQTHPKLFSPHPKLFPQNPKPTPSQTFLTSPQTHHPKSFFTPPHPTPMSHPKVCPRVTQVTTPIGMVLRLMKPM